MKPALLAERAADLVGGSAQERVRPEVHDGSVYDVPVDSICLYKAFVGCVLARFDCAQTDGAAQRVDVQDRVPLPTK